MTQNPEDFPRRSPPSVRPVFFFLSHTTLNSEQKTRIENSTSKKHKISETTMNIKLYLWWISFISLAFLPDANGGGDGGGGEEVTEGAIENLFEKLSASNADDDEPEDPLQQYFYLTDPELPIVEYEGLAEGEEDKPDFIYNPESVKGVRLVEFYAHWYVCL